MSSDDPPPLRPIWLGTVPYRSAWRLQQVLAKQRANGAIRDDLLLLLEHPPVFTMGRGGDKRHLGDGPKSLIEAGAEYIEVDRGGSVTFHGPGQLVAYPIVRLADVFPIANEPDRGDVLRYVRALEGAVIATAARADVNVGLRPPYTGVWNGNAKLASIGVKLSSGITQHGLAMNICTNLEWFALVTPCGIDDSTATSLLEMHGTLHTPEQVAPVLADELAKVFGRRLGSALPLPAAA